MPRYALLHHDHPAPHFDLLLEAGPVAWTWRLASLPVSGAEVPAERIADHRLLYLDYEGEVSGGRGSVRREDGGDYVWMYQSPGRVVVQLQGARFHGVLELEEGQGGWVVRFTSSGPRC
jgi:hypothetical protein